MGDPRPTAGEMEKIPTTLGGIFPFSFSGTLWTPPLGFLFPHAKEHMGKSAWDASVARPPHSSY